MKTVEEVIARAICNPDHGRTQRSEDVSFPSYISIAQAVLSALDAAGMVVVPRVPTIKMLTDAGVMEGFEDDHPEADRCHIAWWDAMITALRVEVDRTTALER